MWQVHERRYHVLPTIHCLQWNVLYRWSCGLYDSLYKISHWEVMHCGKCTVSSLLYMPHLLVAKRTWFVEMIVSHWINKITTSLQNNLLIVLFSFFPSQYKNVKKILKVSFPTSHAARSGLMASYVIWPIMIKNFTFCEHQVDCIKIKITANHRCQLKVILLWQFRLCFPVTKANFYAFFV